MARVTGLKASGWLCNIPYTLRRFRFPWHPLRASSGSASHGHHGSELVEKLNARMKGLPKLLGICVDDAKHGWIRCTMSVQDHHMASNGYVHAGSIVTFADTTAGYGTYASLPESAYSFTTIELKCNLLDTAKVGEALSCVAQGIHLGKNTQVWDAQVSRKSDNKLIAAFRCTQMILYHRGNKSVSSNPGSDTNEIKS